MPRPGETSVAGRHRRLEATVSARSEALDDLQQGYSLAEAELAASRQRARKLEADLGAAAEAAAAAAARIQALEATIGSLNDELELVHRSRSMQLTRPLRLAADALRTMVRAARSGGRAFAHLLDRPGVYVGLARGKPPGEILALARGFLGRGGPKPVAPEPVRFDLRSTAGPIVILTTHHCEYIARAMRAALERVGIAAQIIFERPSGGYADVPHFVICPQMFPVLPGFYVAFQMEQSVSSRWFTDDYLGRLENSFAVFDYSTRNISFRREGLSLKQIYYLPVGHLPGLAANLPSGEEADDYDVVFYGDANNERRQAFLHELRKYCRVRVVSEVFGEELYRILRARRWW